MSGMCVADAGAGTSGKGSFFSLLGRAPCLDYFCDDDSFRLLGPLNCFFLSFLDWSRGGSWMLSNNE